MGWSIENARPQLDIIFTNEGKRYRIQHPQALSPRVYIQHEGELSTEVKSLVSAVFPSDVYIDFFPNTSFAGERNQSTGKPGVRRVTGTADNPAPIRATVPDATRGIRVKTTKEIKK